MSKKQRYRAKQNSQRQKRPFRAKNKAAQTNQAGQLHPEVLDKLPDHVTIRPLRQTTILQMQQQYGNTSVQHMLQREEAPTSEESAASPAGRGSADIMYVSFQNVAPPSAPDHSQLHPGPNGATANRAGYTRVRIQKRMSIVWGNGSRQADGRVPLFARSVNVFYRLDPIELYVSSQYAEDGCPYRVTLAHERSHLRDFLRIFHSGRAALLEVFSGVVVPTASAPRLVQPDDIGDVQDEIGVALATVIRTHSTQLAQKMEIDRNAKDTPAAYRILHAQCPASEW